MKKLLLTTAFLSLTAGAAMAELTTQQIADMFPGASKIEIQRGATTTKVEAVVGSDKIEVVFDNATDAELKREVKTLTDQQLADETGDHNGVEDDSGDDSSDDHSDDSSDDNEDDSSDDHGDDHDDDHGDDHGDGHDSGGDD